MTSLRSLKPSDGTLNVLDFGLNNDGVTYNDQPWINFRLGLKSYGRGSIFSGVTITPGSPTTKPATFNFTAHGLQEGDALVFSTTGTLPSPLVAGQVYYVLSKAPGIAGGPGVLTADTFQLSSTNVSLYFQGPTPGVSPAQIPVAVTSAGTGTHSFQLSGTEKIRVVFPPGHYKFGDPNIGGDTTSFTCGVRNLDVTWNGVFVNEFSTGDFGEFYSYAGANEGGLQLWAYIQSYTDLRQNYVVLANSAEAFKFTIGGWVLIMGVDTQAPFGGLGSGGPGGDANNHACEYAKVTGISGGTIYLDRTLTQAYLSTWPIFYSGVSPTTPGIATQTDGGAACMLPMHPGWDTKRIFRGIHSTAGGQTPMQCRELQLEDCHFDGRGPYPGNTGRVEFVRCSWSTASDMEVDKLNEFVGFYNCYIPCTISMQSASTNHTVFRDSYVTSLGGTDKNVTIDHCRIDNLSVGPLGFGVTESLIITNSSIGQLTTSNTFWSPGASQWQNKLGIGLINNYTFNDGVLSQPMIQQALTGGGPISTGANAWAVPGSHMYFADYAGRWDNIGSPFKVTDIFMTPAESAATTVSIAGNGSAVGTGTPVDAVVTWSAAGAPNNGDIIVFTGPKYGWPFTPNFSVQPWLIIPYYPFIVIQKGAGGLASNQFKLAKSSDYIALTPVQMTGPMSAVQAILNPVFNIQTTLKTLPTGNSRNISGAQISIANPTVITWGPGAGSPHGLVVDDVVIFTTTSSLPGAVVSGVPQGIVPGQPYYVMSAGLTANTFQVSYSPSVQGTPPQSTLGYTQSGTHTAISNPIQFGRHPCVRLTALGNFGGFPTSWNNDITSMDGAYNEPMYSRCRGAIGGLASLDSAYIPQYYAWGNVKLITINVVQPWTGTGTCTMTLTSPVFDPSLNRSTDTQIINCATAGIRTISRTTTSGGVAGDTINAITKWLSGYIRPSFSFSSGGGGTTAFPLIDIEILTDQGIAAVNNLSFWDSHTGYGHAYVMSGGMMINRPS